MSVSGRYFLLIGKANAIGKSGAKIANALQKNYTLKDLKFEGSIGRKTLKLFLGNRMSKTIRNIQNKKKEEEIALKEELEKNSSPLGKRKQEKQTGKPDAKKQEIEVLSD